MRTVPNYTSSRFNIVAFISTIGYNNLHCALPPMSVTTMVILVSQKCATICKHGFVLQVCGGNWTDHNMNTGGSWRCNLAAAPPTGDPNDPSAPPTGDPNDPSAPPFSTHASSSAAASSSFFTAVFGRVADAGMKWRLEHFMRRYLAHECSQRQLQVCPFCHIVKE